MTEPARTPFEAAQQVLLDVTGQRNGDIGAWMVLAEAARGLVDAEGRSHLATLIRHDKRLLRGSLGVQPALREIAALADASRAAGWRPGKDGEAIVESALMRGCVDVLEWAARLDGLPDAAKWNTIGVPPLDDKGAPRFAAPRMPAPCAWAAMEQAYATAGLKWWIARGLSLPERVLDHASPTTLSMLLQAGRQADAATLEAWRTRTRPDAAQPLSSSGLARMLETLAEVMPTDAAVGAEQARVRGEHTLHLLGNNYIHADTLRASLDAWRAASAPGSAWPPLAKPAMSVLLRKFKTPVPWWMLALAACMGNNTSTHNLAVVFGDEAWSAMAGPAPRFQPGTPEEDREAMLGFALWSAWAIAGSEENGATRLDAYGQVTARSAACAHGFVRKVMAWADLDEAGAGRCLGRLLTLAGSGGRSNRALDARLQAGLRAMLLETLAADATPGACGQADCAALLGVLEAPGAPRNLVGGAHFAVLNGTLDPAKAGRKPTSPVSNSDRLRIGGGLLAGAEDAGTALGDPLFGHLVGLIEQGVTPGEGGWPKAWTQRPALLALLAQSGLQSGVPVSRPRRRG